MAVMSMGRLLKVQAVVKEDTSAEEVFAEETRAFMEKVEEASAEEFPTEETGAFKDRVGDGGRGAVAGDFVKRRNPPPYMIKLFKDQTR